MGSGEEYGIGIIEILAPLQREYNRYITLKCDMARRIVSRKRRGGFMILEDLKEAATLLSVELKLQAERVRDVRADYRKHKEELEFLERKYDRVEAAIMTVEELNKEIPS